MDIFDEKGLEKFPDNITKFVGADFKDTYRKVKSSRVVGKEKIIV